MIKHGSKMIQAVSNTGYRRSASISVPASARVTTACAAGLTNLIFYSLGPVRARV